MATTGETSTPRKLTELRVVDLKSELEKRGLEKTGIKAALTERLKKAVEEEGNDPEEYLFELGITVAKKNVTPKEDVEETEEPEAETNDTEAPTNEDTAMDTAEVAPESTSDETENKSDEEKKPEEEPENTDGDDTLVEAPKPEEEKVEEALDDGISISIEDEEKLLAEEEEVSEKKANETNESEAKGDKEGDSKPAVQATADKDGDTAGKDSQDMSEEPPEPDSVPPVAPFTTEDIIKLDTSSERKADEDISMIVHIDESQDDLDADLETPKKQPPGSLTDEKSGDAASGTEKEAEAVKCENKQADAKSEKKDETVSGTAADSETKTEKPATTTDKKDNKKDETNSDAKKETSVGDSKDKKESAEKKDVKSKSAAKPDAKKAAVANSRNLWVSGLSSSTRATDLKALFSKHGKVAGAKVVTNARSPGSRCYGFVTMSTAEEASKCIQHLHRTELHGRMISVERAKNDPSPVKPPTKKPSESTPSKAPVKKEVVKKDAPGKTDKDKKDGEKVAEKRPGGSSHTRTRTSSTGDKRPTATRGTAQRPANDKTASRSQSRDKSNAKPGTPAAPTAAKKGAEGQDVLSFDKIKEERERERLRQKERQLREEERRRMRDLERQRERQRDVERRQREEAMRLEREKERLRLEKSRLEREKLEAEREKIALERERQKRERERLEREREEERRRDEQMRVDEQRRAAKRTFDSRGGTGGRDGSFDSWNAPSKRPSMSDNRSGFDNNSRNNFGGRRVVERYNPRDEHGNDQDRPRDRNYEDRNRRGSGRDEGRGDRGRNTSDNRYDRNFEDRNNREGGGRDTRPDRGDTNQRVRDDRPRISPHGGRTNPRDPARREGGRTDWKQENRTQPPHRDSTRDTRNQNPDRNYSERGPGSRDNGWQGNNNVVDDRGKSRTSYQPNTGPGILGGFPAGDWDARPQAQSSQVRPGDRQWTATTQLSGGLRTQGGMVSNQPMMTHTPGTTGQFMAAAANIMAGVGMGATRDKVPRYDAYSQIQGNVRRY